MATEGGAGVKSISSPPLPPVTLLQQQKGAPANTFASRHNLDGLASAAAGFPPVMPLPPVRRGLVGNALMCVESRTGFTRQQMSLALQVRRGRRFAFCFPTIDF